MIGKMCQTDMHVHSNFSDGRNSVKRLILDAKEKNVKALVLTDHDTIDGVPLFIKQCNEYGIDCMTGTEMSSTSYYNQNVDILGYGFNLKDFEVQCSALLRYNIEVRRKWLAKVLELYKKNRIMDYSLEKLQKHFRLPAKVSNKYWILAARVEQLEKSGFKTHGRPIDFARNELKKGGIYYIPKDDYISTKKAIEGIKKCGGLAVWAHPSKTLEKIRESNYHYPDGVFEHLLMILVSYGLDGLEINTPYLKDNDNFKFIKKCSKKCGVEFFTGGSDYHGEYGINDGCHIGCAGLSYNDFLKIKHNIK